jgi:hypothetical protein
LIDRLSGRWATIVRSWPTPGDTTSVAVLGGSTSFAIHDGRYLLMNDTCGLGPKRYADTGILAFDVRRFKYEMSWVDNQSTDLLYLVGMVNDSGNVLTLTGDRRDTGGAKVETVKIIMRSFDGNNRQLEIWQQKGSAKFVKVREIRYARSF